VGCVCRTLPHARGCTAGFDTMCSMAGGAAVPASFPSQRRWQLPHTDMLMPHQHAHTPSHRTAARRSAPQQRGLSCRALRRRTPHAHTGPTLCPPPTRTHAHTHHTPSAVASVSASVTTRATAPDVVTAAWMAANVASSPTGSAQRSDRGASPPARWQRWPRWEAAVRPAWQAECSRAGARAAPPWADPRTPCRQWGSAGRQHEQLSQKTRTTLLGLAARRQGWQRACTTHIGTPPRGRGRVWRVAPAPRRGARGGGGGGGGREWSGSGQRCR
jgi:hypothetical protein